MRQSRLTLTSSLETGARVNNYRFDKLGSAPGFFSEHVILVLAVVPMLSDIVKIKVISDESNHKLLKFFKVPVVDNFIKCGMKVFLENVVIVPLYLPRSVK